MSPDRVFKIFMSYSFATAESIVLLHRSYWCVEGVIKRSWEETLMCNSRGS